jgi:PHD-finger
LDNEAGKNPRLSKLSGTIIIISLMLSTQNQPKPVSEAVAAPPKEGLLSSNHEPQANRDPNNQVIKNSEEEGEGELSRLVKKRSSEVCPKKFEEGHPVRRFGMSSCVANRTEDMRTPFKEKSKIILSPFYHQKQEGHCEKENQDGRDQNQEDRNQGGKKHVEAFSAQKDKTHEEEEQKQESTCPGTEEKTETGTQAKKEKAQSTRCNVCQKTKSLVPCKTCRRSFHAKCVGFNKRSEMPKKFKCSHCRYSLFFTIGDLLP